MASERIQLLLALRPFKGIDTTSAGLDVPQGVAISGLSADTTRLPSALTAARGRNLLAQITTGGLGSQVQSIAACTTINSNDEFIIGTTLLAGTTTRFSYDVDNATQTVLNFGGTPDNVPFSQAVQYGSTLYDNGGHQYSATNLGHTYLWHYPAPDPTTYNYNVASGVGTMPAGTYYYAFTQQVVSQPNPGAFSQETSPTGPTATGNPLSTYSYVSNGALAANLTGTFVGTMPDGASFTTNVYRQSSLTGIWYFIVNLTTNALYHDNNFDSTVAGNAIMAYNRDQPPVTSNAPNYAVVFRHQERMWNFLSLSNADTAFQTQCQLWFSNAGRPWEFNKLPVQDGGNVMLVGNSNQPPLIPNVSPTYNARYGDWPVAAVSLSSVAILFKSQTMFIVYGTDQTNFVADPFWNKGCRSAKSVIVAPTDNGTACFFLASDRTVCMTDGQSLIYLSEPIRRTLEALSDSDCTNCVGSYNHHTYWISFPGLGQTFGYNTTAGAWVGPLPYGTTGAITTVSNPVTPFSSVDSGEVLAIRTSTNFIDSWFAGGDIDLGSFQTVTWTGPVKTAVVGGEAGGPLGNQMEFTHLLIMAPVQAGLTATVTLTVDSVSVSKVFNLGNGLTTHIIDVGTDSPTDDSTLAGYTGQLSVTFTTVAGLALPAQVWAVEAYGVMKLNLVPQADDV